MSQQEVLKILKKLGGKATTKQISQYAKKNYPDTTLHTYVAGRLKKLENWGYIIKKGEFWELEKNK